MLSRWQLWAGSRLLSTVIPSAARNRRTTISNTAVLSAVACSCLLNWNDLPPPAAHPARHTSRRSAHEICARSDLQDREVTMATTATTQTEAGSKHSASAEQKIEKLRELFADAPEVGKTALRN